MNTPAPDLYRKYFIDRDFERLDLFQLLAEKFPIQRVLYPGSFVHVTPSFVFPDVVYVDNVTAQKGSSTAQSFVIM